MRRIAVILGMLIAAAIPSRGGIQSYEGPGQVVPLYGRADFRIYVSGSWNNPYLQEEAAVDLLLTAPSGARLRVPCFLDSVKKGQGAFWAARFTPQEKGTYSYSFTCREGGKEAETFGMGRFKVVSKQGHGILHTNGLWTLRYDDGTLFRGIGENLCWESRTEDDSRFFKALHERHERYNYPVLLPDFAANGGNFTRMWMCSWNFPIDRHADFNNARYEPSEEYFNPSAVRRLDETIGLAERLGIRIMLCIGPGDVVADRDFFTSDAAKARYRNHLRYIVARWGYSPAIAMWEFFNEADNIQFARADAPIPAAEIVAWHQEMAAFLKSLDPYGHVITTSISHRDIEGLNDIPDIDINQKHIYCNTSDIPATILRYEALHGKPYVIGEFGYEWDWSKNFDDFADGMIADFKRGLWYGLFSPTPVMPMNWWWEWFDNRGLGSYLRNVRMVSDRMLAAGKGEFIPIEASGGEAYAVRCGKTTWLYVYNPGEEELKTVNVAVPAGRRKVRTLDFARAAFGKAKTIRTKAEILELQTNIPSKGEALYEID